MERFSTPRCGLCASSRPLATATGSKTAARMSGTTTQLQTKLRTMSGSHSSISAVGPCSGNAMSESAARQLGSMVFETYTSQYSPDGSVIFALGRSKLMRLGSTVSLKLEPRRHLPSCAPSLVATNRLGVSFHRQAASDPDKEN